MSTWRHLFLDGEFSPRLRLLSGLTLAQVLRRPAGASHSIYEELWHTAKWQTIVVGRDQAARDAYLSEGFQYPDQTPDDEQAWSALVKEFLLGAEKAVEWGQSSEEQAAEVEVGVTVRDVLEGLAVHNAYHLGKIVALRQAIGAWPPPSE
ncbi:MAG: DinB family protein [Candidatus Zixiibacteriota bacterium]